MSDILNDERVELLSVKEVAICYGVTPNTIWRWNREGKLPKPARFGGTTKWSRRQIIDDIKQKFQR